MSGSFLDRLELLPVLLPAFLLSVMIHELAHGVVAFLLGDRTARRDGRLSLNPVPHIDMWGLIAYVFTLVFTNFRIGWAKPIPVDRERLAHEKRDMAIIALAGPLANLGIAIGAGALLVHGVGSSFVASGTALGGYLELAVSEVMYLNIMLTVINLLPLPPLDGSRLVGVFMPREMYRDWAKLDDYGILVFLGVVLVFMDQFEIVINSGVQRVGDVIGMLVGG